MNEITVFLIGVFVLLFGVPIGRLLARFTSEELLDGRKWFEALIVLSLLGGVTGFFMRNDGLMFSCFFIALVTSQSLRFEKVRKKRVRKKSKKN